MTFWDIFVYAIAAGMGLLAAPVALLVGVLVVVGIIGLLGVIILEVMKRLN